MRITRTTPNVGVGRDGWSLRQLPSGRWQARYRAPDGEMYAARTGADKPLTFLTQTDARTWLADVYTKIAGQERESPAGARIRASHLPVRELNPARGRPRKTGTACSHSEMLTKV